MNKIDWHTPEMSELLKRMYTSGRSAELAKQLGCTLNVVQKAASRMGLSAARRAPSKPAQVGKNMLFGSPRPSTVKPASTATIDISRARITIAEPKLDMRFQAAPGHVGEFSRLGVGRYAE